MNAPDGPKGAAARRPQHGFAAADSRSGSAPTPCGASSRSTSRRSRRPAVDIVAHRVLWSLPFLALLIVLSRGWAKVRAALARPTTLGILSLTALLIGGNWLLYVYAVTSGHILAASFGYYLNPLANVLLGRFVLHERLNRLQWAAVAIAAAGISRARRRRARPAVDQPRLVRQLRALRAAAENRARRRAHRPWRSRQRSCSRWRSRGSAGWSLAAQPVIGTSDRDNRPAAARRRDLDHAAAAVHRGRQAPALFDARHAPVPRADAAVPDRGRWSTASRSPGARVAFAAIWTALALYVVALLRAPRLRSRPNDVRASHVQPRLADHRLRRADLRARRLHSAARLGQLADHPAGDHRRGDRHDLARHARAATSTCS